MMYDCEAKGVGLHVIYYSNCYSLQITEEGGLMLGLTNDPGVLWLGNFSSVHSKFWLNLAGYS